MKLTIMRPTEIEVTHIVLDLPVYYGDEDMPLDYPSRFNNRWRVTVNLETGQILDWPTGTPAHNLYMKVDDGGTYILLAPGDNGPKEVSILKNEYVPHGIVPHGTVPGDYVELKIDATGRITNWPAPDDLEFEEFFPECDRDQ